jgi:hypothetical protein
MSFIQRYIDNILWFLRLVNEGYWRVLANPEVRCPSSFLQELGDLRLERVGRRVLELGSLPPHPQEGSPAMSSRATLLHLFGKISLVRD